MQAHRLLALALVTGCASPPPRALPRPSDLRPLPHPEASQPVDSMLAALSTRQRVAQLVVPWLAGNYTAFDDSLFQVAARWVDSLEVGGLIISVGSPFDIAAKLNTLQRRSRLPLLVSADLEWGAGMRVIGGTAFPQIMAVGATGNHRDAYPIGEAAATEGPAGGVHAVADVVMSAHLAFPPFTGSDDPAPLSAAVLTGLLRDSLHFRGLVVADALVMGAIVAKYGAGEATGRAFLAGSDLLLMPADPDSALNAMTAAVEGGRVSRDRLDASVRRVLEIKRRLGLFAHRVVALDSIMTVVGSKRFQDGANDIAVRALTLVRDIGGPLHALRGRPSRFALIAYADENNGAAGLYMTELLRQGGDTVDYFRLWPMSGPLSYDSARAVIARAPATVFVANVRPISWRGNIALPDSLAQLVTATDAARPTVLVSLGSPYLLNQAPAAKSYLIAWSGVRAAERAVALALLGKVPIAGHLPIRTPPDYPIGFGVTIPTAHPLVRARSLRSSGSSPPAAPP